MEMRLTLVKPSERALCAMQINSIREYYALEAVNGFVNGFVGSRSGSSRAWRGVAWQGTSVMIDSSMPRVL